MVKRNILRLFPVPMVLGLVLVLTSCSKEDRFENWLTKKEATWQVSSASERLVEYFSDFEIDSSVVEQANSNVAGEFVFNEDGSFDYDFNSQNLNIQFKGSGERLLDGQTFSHATETQSATEDVIKQWISGEKTSSRELTIKMGVSWCNLSGIYLRANFELVMERAD